MVHPPQHLSLTLGPSKSYTSLLSQLISQFGQAHSCAAQCIQDLNLQLMDPSGRFQENLHPLSFAMKKHDADTPTYYQAMCGVHADEYCPTMAKEIQKGKHTWHLINRDSLTLDINILPSTWVFKCK